MNLGKFKHLFTLLLLGTIGFIVHKGLFYFFVPIVFEEGFIYSLPLLYSFFFFSSATLVLILDQVKKNSINSVGYTFLLLTIIKMVIAYIFLRPILAANLPKTPTEKMSFFIIFIYFLTIETYVAIRILNNKQ
jgi:hypothetical protein